MTKVDQFESVFRAAAKARFEYVAIKVGSVLVVSDEPEGRAVDLGARVRSFLTALDPVASKGRVAYHSMKLDMFTEHATPLNRRMK
ncbi:MAG: hypothetical protein OEO79_05700 [Gemmatimonadota bacterium]|nr:hypothetical protein [Gemmatimonadota bacterium]MDH3421756.1 hypothetical protein [Gemmatimonadota bacterium]